MLKGFPVEVDAIYEGERIKEDAAFVDLGGPKTIAAELLRVASIDSIKDGIVEIVGPDIPQMKEGSAYPFGIFIRVAGEKLEEDLEGVFERKIHDFLSYVQGFMHLNSRDTIWCRMSKEAAKKGLTLQHLGNILVQLFRKEWNAIQKIQVTFYTRREEVEKFREEARRVYEKRDSRLRTLKDEEVDRFYGCTMCQSFASHQMCVITPNRTPGCGAISWVVARAAVKLKPQDPTIFEIPKGEVLDAKRGEYSSADKIRAEKGKTEISRVYLHSIFEHPHSTGLMEVAVFYIPEVDGIGLAHKEFAGATPLGMSFSDLQAQIATGLPMDGFMGVSVEYLRSPKFLQGDGGWSRIVWLPEALREKVKSFIPAELVDKIATEKHASEIDALKKFLKEKAHPVVKRWKAEPEAAPGKEAAMHALLRVGKRLSINIDGAEIRIKEIIIEE